MAAKEDHQHLVHDQLPDIDYCPNDSPGIAEAVLLGFQHFVTMIGTTVLIPSLFVYEMGGNTEQLIRVIQTLLFVNGVMTLVQSFFGTRLPIVMNASFSYVIPIWRIVNSPRYRSIFEDYERFYHTLRAIQGALICASIIQIILGFSGLWAVLLHYLSPLSVAPVIALVGLGLFEYGFPGVASCIEIGLPEVILLIIISQFLGRLSAKKKLPFFERFPVLISAAIIWAYAHLLTVSGAYKHATELGKDHCRTDRAHFVKTAPWVRLPFPLEWGAPTFNAGDAFAFLASAFVSQVESTATIYGVSRLSNATPPPPFIVGRSIGWQGIGVLLNGLFGTITGSAVSVENAGLVGLTRVGSRLTVQIAALFMIVLSIFGKFGAIVASIPQPIVAAINSVLYAVLAAVGLSYLQFTNLNIIRNLFILGFTLFMGFSIPQYFYEFTISSGHGPVHTGAGWFNDILNTIFSSNAMVGFILVVILDNALKTHKKNRGYGWWKKYHKWKTSATNEEFYKLPFNLNKYFPPPQV
ncbi:nucleobase-ascorbate transporter 1 [Selaginella moellendorffii]|uniref:nucleobase-ascorbate transporter 1 n=1 Tax=Selaginella moellendorffii TaxID=88036 RepID=UPI000D1C6D3B|nr:nucleobase-ascorbate transporter 1 [Selaginella moellendorffii]|eukprot:XP_024524652.1 nucleobase-ascorbate transporter 1 [Selaginella moellendorffii]